MASPLFMIIAPLALLFIIPWLPLLILLTIYVLWTDSHVSQHPKAMALASRWSEADIDGLAAKHENLDSHPATPKTGRRYIVTGGTGFIGGHIVLHLIRRGEDPKNIRILDLRPPTRRDLLTGPAKDVGFIRVDVTDAQSVLAAFNAPWPDGASDSEITVFHTVASIRFFERHKVFLSLSSKVNISGTKNVVDASLAVGASILINTSSCTVAVRRQRFLLWPWETEVRYPVQVLTDDDTNYPKLHEEMSTNYSYSKAQAERLIKDADKQPTSKGTLLRTGWVRIGNGIFGPGGELFDHCIRGEGSIVFNHDICSHYCYVENAVLGHLCYEQRLIELAQGSKNPDIGGQGFLITDPNPPTLGLDLYMALARLSHNKLVFRYIPLTLLVLFSYLVEGYALLWECVLPSWLKRIIPRLSGDILNLQPAVFNTSYNIIVDDSRARLPPEKGGLGYNAQWTTLDGVYRTWAEHRDRGPLTYQAKGSGFGSAKL